MNTYQEFINQSFELPQEEFEVDDSSLLFNGVNLEKLIAKHGTPLRLTYLPKIGDKIQSARKMFSNAFKEHSYKGEYMYTYCTKSSHFSFVLDEVLKQNAQIETSSAFDIALVRRLFKEKKITKELHILANGYKRPLYTQYLTELINDGFKNCTPIIDNLGEIEAYKNGVKEKCQIGIRVATDEEPSFTFYTSRLGVRYADVPSLYDTHIANDDRFSLKLLHFFINTGVGDRPYYWNELSKFVTLYCNLKARCPDLDTIDIGGGLPALTQLETSYDHQTMITDIIGYIKDICDQHGVPEPHIITEFGTYTVAESGAMLYSILDQKLQNDKELWYMIDGSFITNLPDIWGLNQEYIMLPINCWDQTYNKVNLGGLTCDSKDYYNSERHKAEIILPLRKKDSPLHIGFFHTGAYQESLGGFGGIQHCLVPHPKHIILKKDDSGMIIDTVFAEEQNEDRVLEILGY